MEQPIGRITISPEELDLTHTLTLGQSFRWKEDERGRWTGVVRRRVVTVWREGGDICHTVTPGGPDNGFIRDYFRTDVSLADLCRGFIEADPRMADAVRRFRGLRVIRQEPEEILLSYICSAANSVERISKSVEIMSQRYGDLIANVEGRDYYSFPSADAIANADPDDVGCSCCLGFRGGNVCSVARQLVGRSVRWLDSLRCADYDTARGGLLSFKGVGAKIADCVLLFSLDKDSAVPVDTHVRRIAVERYLPEFRQKTLTDAVYRQIAGDLQSRFGAYAGWAQEYLFYDDLLRRTRRDPPEDSSNRAE